MQALAAQRAVAWSPGPVDANLTQAISDDTKGNPFFVRALVLHWMEEGRLRLEEGCWRATAPIAELSVPEDVRQVLRRRFGRLSEDTQSFLTVAAAVGGSFRFDVVAAVAEIDEARALAAVDRGAAR